MAVAYTIVKENAETPIFDLTVVTVCRNVLAELKETTASVLRQKAKHSISIEHIIVDGASTDGTPEWLVEIKEQGKIESYVSEPDCGIYDAMNKGINMARGQVLAFLNAGDTYTEEDLSCCVHPIMEGKTQSTAAYAWITGRERIGEMAPTFEQMHLYTPCCHQAFFAIASLYRQLRGYEVEDFPCAADGDIMYRIIRTSGVPQVIDTHIVNFAYGGFSTDSINKFRDENILMLWRHREMILERCDKEVFYAEVILAHLLNHCRKLCNWQREHNKRIPERLEELKLLLETVAPKTHALRYRLLARAARLTLASLTRSETQSVIVRAWATFCYVLGHLSPANTYINKVPYPNTPFFRKVGEKLLLRR